MTHLSKRSLVFTLAFSLIWVAGCGGGAGGANGSDPDVASDLIVTQTTPTNLQEVAGDLSDPGLGGIIQVFFSEKLLASTVIDPTNTFNYLTSDVNILNSAFERLAGVATITGDGDVISFTPDGDLLNGQYTITVSRDVMNFQGGRLNRGLSDHRSSFTVGPDIYAPVIRNTFPAPNQTDVPKNSQIIITFNESLASGTVSTSSVTIIDGSANPPVPIAGSLNVVRDDFEIIFTPDPSNPMPANATIVVTVTGGNSGVKDRADNPFEGDVATPGTYQFQFQTVNEPPPPNNPLTIDVNNFDALIAYADSTHFGTLREAAYIQNPQDQTQWGVNNPIPNSRTRIGSPGEIIFDPRFGALDGHTFLYVIDRSSRSVTIVGSRDSKIVHRWKDLSDPRGLGIDGGTTLYVTNYGNDSLTLMDIAPITVGASIPSDILKSRSAQANRVDIQVGRGPVGVAWCPASGEAFVANSIDNTCSVVNSGSGAINTTFATGTSPQDVAATFDVGVGWFAFITCLGGGNDDNGSVSLYWSAPNGLQASITGFKNPKGCIYDRGISAWIANSGGDTVSKLTLQVAGGGFAATILPSITATGTVGKNPTSVTIEPWAPAFGGLPTSIITADRGSSQITFTDATQPIFPNFSLQISGVQEVASYFDQ